jgi:hypothetical protein
MFPLVVFLFLSLLAVVIIGGHFLAAPLACHVGGDIVCFGGVTEVSGSVWGPCNYTGVVEIVGGPPVDWGRDDFKCVAAGRAGGRTYAVFTRTAEADYPTGDPFKTEIERDLCYCAREGLVPCMFYKPAVLIEHVGTLVVDVEEGVGYLSIAYWFPYWLFNHSRFIFGDGVYLNMEGLTRFRAAVGAKREIMGPLLEGCAYRVKVRLEPDKLTISRPLYNVTARVVRVG